MNTFRKTLVLFFIAAIMTISTAQGQSCDTLRNYNPNDDFWQFTTANGFILGHDILSDGTNNYNTTIWSESYSVGAATEVRAIRFAPWKATDEGTADSIAFNVYQDNAGVPGAIISTEWIRYDEITVNQYNFIELSTPAPVNGTFHVGYELSFDATQDSFALIGTQPATNYTQFYADGTGGLQGWYDVSTIYTDGGGNPLNTAFVLDVLTSTAIPPTADFNILSASAVCLGNSFQVDGSPTTGAADIYSWILGDNPYTTTYDDATGLTTTLTPTTSNPSAQAIYLIVDGACVFDVVGYTVDVYPAVAATVNVSDPTCGNANGEINITGASGGDATYTYSIDGGATSQGSGLFSNLAPATYNVVVSTNGDGCEYTETVTLNNIPAETIAVGADGSICEGDSYELTASGNGSIEWFDDLGTSVGTGISVMVSPTATTTYDAVLTDGNGCTNTDQVTVTVNPVNDASFTYSSNTLCLGGANETPIINGTGTFTSTPTGLVFINTSTGEIDMTSSTAGTYDVTFTTTGVCGEVETQSITLTSSPDATFSYSSASFCAEVGTESPTFPGGASAGSFSSTPAGLDLNTSNGTITLDGSTPGTYDVTNTIAASGSCPADNHIETVTINALPVVDAGVDQEICEGEEVTLTATVSAGTISWDNGVTDGVPFTPTATNTYTVTAIDNGCISTDEVIVTVNDLPIVDAGTDETACENHDPLTLTGTPTGGTFSGTSVTGNEFDPSVGVGTYTITYTYTDGNGCEGSDDLIITVDGCASIDENSISESITIMPNPATDYIDVVIEGKNTINSIQLLSAEGRVVELSTSTLNAITTRIDVSSATKGTYFIQVNTLKGQITKKVILQ